MPPPQGQVKSVVEPELWDLSLKMRRTCLFSHLNNNDMRRVTSSMDRISFRRGEQLGAAEGEPTKAIYVIVKGKVERRRAGYVVDTQTIENLPIDSPSWSAHSFGRKDKRLRHTRLGEEVDGGGGVNPGAVEEEDAAPSEPQGGGAAMVETVGEGSDLAAFGTLHALGGRASYATATALTDGVAYRLGGRELRNTLFGAPSAAEAVALGLSSEVFRLADFYRTPLLEQPAQVVNVAAVSVAAAFEAYYRSALNSIMNAALVGGAAGGGLFPSMHVQIPVRVAYINGFKASRSWLATEANARLEADRDGALGPVAREGLRLAPVLLPGVLMTPASGLLEACNAGHVNAEPLHRRSVRGLLPRGLREVIFGVGLNQLSDYCEERVPHGLASSKVARNALGSVAAGLAAGYLSHIPHNLSQMKLLQPRVSYRDHFGVLVGKALSTLPPGVPPHARRACASVAAVVSPTGLMIRSTQIVGSFVLLNGISHLLDVRLWDHSK